MDVITKSVSYDDKEFKLNKTSNNKTHYSCIHRKIKCKAMLTFDNISKKFELITGHNAKCKLIIDVEFLDIKIASPSVRHQIRLS